MFHTQKLTLSAVAFFLATTCAGISGQSDITVAIQLEPHISTQPAQLPAQLTVYSIQMFLRGLHASLLTARLSQVWLNLGKFPVMEQNIRLTYVQE